MQKTVIIIAGPTASGKTSLAISIAQHFSTAIISADSRQCYRELNIGVAAPSPDELATAPHYFIASHSVKDSISAADFEKYALEKTQLLFEKNDVLVMAGGTGLYIKAFCEGLDEIPVVDENIREDIIRQYEEKGMNWLTGAVREADPDFLSSGEAANPNRLMRALEVKLFTGKAISSFRTGIKKIRDFNIVKYGLEIPRQQLNERINRRVDQMIDAGLEQEVRSLEPYQQLNALQTVGYKEFFDYFNGKISKEKAIDLIKQHTRQYAKRQMTWFKRDADINWVNGLDQSAALGEIMKSVTAEK